MIDERLIQRSEPSWAMILFGLFSLPLWAFLIIAGCIVGWFAAAFLEGFHQGFADFHLTTDSKHKG